MYDRCTYQQQLRCVVIIQQCNIDFAFQILVLTQSILSIVFSFQVRYFRQHRLYKELKVLSYNYEYKNKSKMRVEVGFRERGVRRRRFNINVSGLVGQRARVGRSSAYHACNN